MDNGLYQKLLFENIADQANHAVTVATKLVL